MLTVMNRIPVHPEYAAAFEARFRDRARLVDTMPGFLRNEVLRPVTEGAPYIVLTHWESREAFDAWTASDAFRQGHARSGSLPPEAFAGRSHLEIHEVLPFGEPSPAPPEAGEVGAAS